MNEPTGFTDITARATREVDVPNASWNDGCNLVASNSNGLGIATDNPNLEQSLPSWTLLDQAELTREPQLGSQIGGIGLDGGSAGVGTEPIYVAQNLGGGAATTVGGATLETLEEGWKVGSSSSVVLLGNSNRNISFATVSTNLGDDFSLTFTWRRQPSPTTSLVVITGSVPNDSVIYISDVGTLTFIDDSDTNFNMSNGIASVPVGTDVDVEIRVTTSGGQTVAMYLDGVIQPNTYPFSSTISLDILYGSTSSPSNVPANSYIKNFILNNLTTAEQWKWPVDDGGISTQLTVACYDETDTPIPAFDGTISPDANWDTL
jgi:hypothetical protein